MSSIEPGEPSGHAPDTSPGSVDVEVDVLDTHEAGPAAMRGSILRTGSYVLGILLSLISARVLITHLGLAQFGRYTLVMALVTIVAGFTEGGLNNVVMREFATVSAEHRREVMAAAIGMRLVLTIIGVAFALAFAAVAGYGSTLVIGTALAGVGIVLQLLQSTLGTSLQAQLRFGWVSAAELVRQGVYVGLVIALALSGAGLIPLLAASIPAAVVSLAVTIPLVRSYTPLRPSFHAGHWWRLLRETIPWAVIAAVNIVYFRVAYVLMSLIASELQTGYFATSFRVSEVLLGIPSLIVAAAFPILARAAREDSARFDFASGRIFELALVAGTLLVMCLEVGAGFAIHVIAGAKADPAISVLRIQGLALIASFIAVACGYPLLMLRRFREVLLSNMIALAISAVLTLSLAPGLGARGTAIAALVAEIGLAASQVIMLKRAAPGVNVSLTSIVVVAFAGAVGALAGLVLPIHPVLGALVACLVYLGVLRLLGRLPAEAREILSGWRGKGVRLG